MSLLNPNSSTRLNQEKSKFFEIDAQSKTDGVDHILPLKEAA